MTIETAKIRLTSSQLDELKKFDKRICALGANFFVCLPNGESVLSSDVDNVFDEYCGLLTQADDRAVHNFESEQSLLGINLKFDGQIEAMAFVQYRQESDDEKYFKAMLELLSEKFESASKSHRQIELVSAELSQTYEELMLLYKMSGNMKVTQSNSNYLQTACDGLTELVAVESIAIFLEKPTSSGKQLVMVAGCGLVGIDRQMADVLYTRLLEELKRGKEALIDSNEVKPFKYEWPAIIKSILAVPLYGNDNVVGTMVATNRLDKNDFDSIDMKLFHSVASQCAVFIENERLFGDIKELDD